jgi:hypothetical protein
MLRSRRSLEGVKRLSVGTGLQFGIYEAGLSRVVVVRNN